MSEWVNCNITKPPEAHSVLLYIVCFHEDGKSIWDENIYSGFYGDEDYGQTGFYLEHLNNDGSCDYSFLEETPRLKVIAWTLLPRKPYRSILEEEWTG